jgi:hypothetical protein
MGDGAVMGSAESPKDTWESIFLRKGGGGAYTRLFDTLEPGQRSTLLRRLVLSETELPVIGSLRDPGNWFVLTTERIVWATRNERHELDTGAIRDAIADLRQLAKSKSKLEMRTLQVTTLSGEEYTIELEPGLPLSGTWNVLKNIGARNRHATEVGSGSSRSK